MPVNVSNVGASTLLLVVAPGQTSAQVAALAAVSGDLSAVAMMRAAFDRRRQTMVGMLEEIPGVTCPEPLGAFYAYPSVKAVLGREIRGQRPATSAALATLILEEVEAP